MEVFEAVRTVLAVRGYRDRQVPAQVRDRVIEAGRLAGSSMNRQPWHFIVVEERGTLRQLATIMTSGPYIADASFAVVVAIEVASAHAVSDASRAIQNMILTAWSDGVGSNWVGFGPLPEVQRLLGVPNTHAALAVVPFGYPPAPIGHGTRGTTKQRKLLGAVASRERFGAL